jgi:hypothetical protein
VRCVLSAIPCWSRVRLRQSTCWDPHEDLLRPGPRIAARYHQRCQSGRCHRLSSSPPGGWAGNATSLITDDRRLDRVCCWKDLLARGPPTHWRVKRFLAPAVAEGRAGGFLGAPCSVAHREFSGISHIRFSMGVFAKLAALHTVERGLIAQASCSHAALPSKRCSARERARLGQRLHRERCHPSFNH